MIIRIKNPCLKLIFSKFTSDLALASTKYNTIPITIRAIAIGIIPIKYLSETLDEKEFINLMSDFNQIKEKGKKIVNEMFEYYNSKYKIKNGLL